LAKMDLLVHGKDQYTRKYSKKGASRASCNLIIEEYQVKNKEPRGSKVYASRKNPNETYKNYSSDYYDSRSTNYSSWSVFDGPRSRKKSGYELGYGKNNDHHELSNYAKVVKSSYNKAFYSDNYSKSTNGSSNSDNESTELNGFKIMMNGNCLHDETSEDFDSGFTGEPGFQSSITMEKYASSVMTTGPKANEISLPSFM